MIDPSKTADGVPAVKADLRGNLLAAKDEIEALRTIATASVKQFGAVGDGVSKTRTAFRVQGSRVLLSGCYALQASNTSGTSAAIGQNPLRGGGWAGKRSAFRHARRLRPAQPAAADDPSPGLPSSNR